LISRVDQKNTIYRALDITDTVCTVNKKIEDELLSMVARYYIKQICCCRINQNYCRIRNIRISWNLNVSNNSKLRICYPNQGQQNRTGSHLQGYTEYVNPLVIAAAIPNHRCPKRTISITSAKLIKCFHVTGSSTLTKMLKASQNYALYADMEKVRKLNRKTILWKEKMKHLHRGKS
jgi:hypothetical protein